MKGFLRIKKEVEPVFNEFGEEISQNAHFETDYIACKYYSPDNQNDRLNFLGKIAGGNFSQVSYIITTKDMKVSGKHFALYDSDKHLICEKDCISLEKLTTIQRIKIII